MFWDLEDPTRALAVGEHDGETDLLMPVLDRGALVAAAPSIHDVRALAAAELSALSPRTRRFLNPQPHPVGLDPIVHERKRSLVAAARSGARSAP
jgi:hypothetical protein